MKIAIHIVSTCNSGMLEGELPLPFALTFDDTVRYS